MSWPIRVTASVMRSWFWDAEFCAATALLSAVAASRRARSIPVVARESMMSCNAEVRYGVRSTPVVSSVDIRPSLSATDNRRSLSLSSNASRAAISSRTACNRALAHAAVASSPL